MNTRDEWVTTAEIHDVARRELWIEVFPDARVPIVSMISTWVSVPERGEVEAYMLDLNALNEMQLKGVIAVIAKRFGYPIEEVEKDIQRGVPILAEDVSVQSTDIGLIFSMLDDDEV